jgi:hypothetical protein
MIARNTGAGYAPNQRPMSVHYELAKLCESPEFFRALDATARSAHAADAPDDHAPHASHAHSWQTCAPFPTDGYLHLPLLTTDESHYLESACRELQAHGLPATFLYMLDTPWQAAQRFTTQLSIATGLDYLLVDDGYAFWVEAPARGWVPHRGAYADCRAENGAPQLINVWLSVTDADIDRACMHCVPLPVDAHYPHALETLGYEAGTARALPTRRGDALAWNANLLHWGGTAKPGAGPRISVTFTLATTAAFATFNLRALAPFTGTMDTEFARRLEFVAAQLWRYRDHGKLDATLFRWAQMHAALAELSAARSRA